MIFLAHCLLALGQEAQAERVTERLPDGGRVEREFVRSEAGEPVSHGDYQRFFADGQLATVGRFAEGKRVGTWESFHLDGTRASVVRYRRGLRNGESRTWSEDGAYLGKKVYAAEFLEFPDGSPRFEGEWLVLGRRIRDGVARWFWEDGGVRCEGSFERGLPSGAFTWFWWDGGVQFEGTFERAREDGEWIARRVGDWTFRHRDGARDPGFLSAHYAEGARAGSLPRSPVPDPSSLPGLAPFPELSEEDGRTITRLLGEMLAGDDEQRMGPLADLSAWDQATLPYVLVAMRDAALQPDGGADYLALRGLLPAGLAEEVFAEPCGEPGAYCAEGAAWELRRWWTAWELFADRPAELLALSGQPIEVWLEVFFGAEPGDASELNRPPPERPAIDASDMRWAASIAEPGAAQPEPAGGASPELQASLAWLSSGQAEDGSWQGDLLATALATRALAASGSTLEHGPHAPALARAVPWLLTQVEAHKPKDAEAPLVEFSEGLRALVRASTRVHDRLLRKRLQGIVDAQIAACTRAAAAGAEPARLAVGALSLFDAEDEGFRVLEEHTAWTELWLETTSAHEDGLRACRLTILLLRGRDALADPRVREDAEELLSTPAAERTPGAWLQGAEALALLGGAPWNAWRTDLLQELVARQVRQGDESGSWAPESSLLAERTARVRSTARAALALALAN